MYTAHGTVFYQTGLCALFLLGLKVIYFSFMIKLVFKGLSLFISFRQNVGILFV